jgi:hypothetical protein
MKKIYYLIITFILTSVIFAQENHTFSKPKNEYTLGISAFHTEIANRNFYGIAIDGKIYIKPKWAVGFNVVVTSKNVANDFNYYVEKPTVTFLEFSFVNHFDIYKIDSFRIGFTLSNGYGTAVLTDRAYTETTDEFFEIPITITTNHFYVLQAGIETAFKLQNNVHGYNIYLKSDIKNRKTFGNANFGTSNDFKGMYFGLGILLVSRL